MTTLPKLNYLTNSSSFVDYRPAIDPTGNSVIFERTPVGGDLTTLQIIPDISNPSPVPFLSGTSPASQTRPDWCWGGSNVVLFNGAASNSAPVSVWAVNAKGVSPAELPGTLGAAYPRWSLEGVTFVTENGGPGAPPKPRNTVFNFTDTRVLFPNASGKDSLGREMYGGMPCVSYPDDLPVIAFAGQPVIPGGWVPNYNQGFNYIFINGWVGGPSGGFVSTPMQRDAPLTAFDPAYEGRAPDWSRGANMIAFESSRSGRGYAIYLYNLQTETVTQVTDPYLNAQHARFFPDSSKLILCAQLNSGTPAMGIAWVDISSLL